MDAVPLPKSATNTATSTSYLYAELLLNIRQVTVSLSLDPPSNKSTRVWLSSDRQSIGLSHDGHKSFLKLPAKVVYPPQSTLPNCQPNQAPVLAIPSPPSQEFSVRLPLADDTPRRTPVVQRADNEMPWSAAKLPISAQFQCCHCANILIPHEYIKTWKDLPSDNWAEMMDFWHCHKPSDHEHTENGETPGTDKGYAASNKLVAKTGVGFVDLCYFLIHPSDVVGIKHIHEETNSRQNKILLCNQCKAVIGVIDDRTEGYRLYKWSLAILEPRTAKPISYPLEYFISAQLLSLIDNQAVRRFVITSDNPAEISGHELWVFNPDLYYTSTTTPNPRRAMKVFSKPIHAAEDFLETRNSSHEEINLPHEIYERLKKILVTSCLAVFKLSRGFEGWDAGVLGRFDSEEFDCHVSR